ncbi:lysophosphatidate acyltransferase, partial [Paragonimus westermani]
TKCLCQTNESGLHRVPFPSCERIMLMCGFVMFVLYLFFGVLGLSVAYRVPVVNFYTKYVVFCAVLSLSSLYYTVEFCLRGRDYKNAWLTLLSSINARFRRFKKVFKLGGYLIGIRPVVKDAHFLTDKPCVFVANHQSMIDVASLVDVWPERCTIISKSSMKYAGPIGFITWLSKLIYIDRRNHKDAVSIMKHTAKIAVADQFPIQPIVISPYTRFLDFENKRFDSATYYVQVLPPISTVGLTTSDVDSLLRETREKMEACFEALKTAEVSPEDR